MKNTMKININGMKCVHCAAHVTDALKAIKEIKKVNVDLENKCANVTYKASCDELAALKENIKNAVSDLGFELVSIEDEK